MGVNLEPEPLIRSIVELRALELAGGPEVVGDVRDQLERLVGPTVSRAVSARVVGVSQTAFDRQVDGGAVATVLTPDGRREVPTTELVRVVLEMREAASRGVDRHVFAAALRSREARAARIARRHLLVGAESASGHRQSELIALAYHRLVASRLDPVLVCDARRRLARWVADGLIAPRWADEWKRVLHLPPVELRRAIGAGDAHGRDLRQSSPFSGALSEPERKRVMELVRSTS